MSGAISPGARLPAQRVLARDLKLSRNTITAAYDGLTSEGLLVGRPGAGTYVVDQPLAAKLAKRPRASPPSDPPSPVPLQQGTPDLGLFPIGEWRRIQERRWRGISASALGYGHPAGWSGLRFLLSQRVAALRGVACAPQQIYIVPTSASGLHLAALALQIQGRQVWVESPGYAKSFVELQNAGARLQPFAVDHDGLRVELGARAAPDAVMAYVTPSSQFPTGAALSSSRRRALLEWARTSGSWILEDDYDAEFVFEGQAPPTLASEAGGERVIYLSTLNNLMFPSLQLAYLVAPAALVDRFDAALRMLDNVTNIPLQMVARDFIESGLLSQHIRRCREVYAERRETLRRALTVRMGSHLTVAHQPLGLHVTAWLRNGLRAADLKTVATAHDVVIHTVADCTLNGIGARNDTGIYMGFSSYQVAAIERAVAKLAKLIDSMGP